MELQSNLNQITAEIANNLPLTRPESESGQATPTRERGAATPTPLTPLQR